MFKIKLYRHLTRDVHRRSYIICKDSTRCEVGGKVFNVSSNKSGLPIMLLFYLTFIIKALIVCRLNVMLGSEVESAYRP